MLDKDIREPLFDFLDDYFGKIRIIEEKIIYRSRADALGIIDGEILGFEIKSDNDTYTRLKTQVRDYEKYCDRCYLVVGKSHEKHAAEHVPDNWGIMVVSPDDVYLLREAEYNKKVNINLQFGILWRQELLNIQKRLEMPKYMNQRRQFIYDKIVDKIGEEEAKCFITDELFERDYTIFDKPNSGSTNASSTDKNALKNEITELISNNKELKELGITAADLLGLTSGGVKKTTTSKRKYTYKSGASFGRKRRIKSSSSIRAAKKRAKVTNYIGPRKKKKS